MVAIPEFVQRSFDRVGLVAGFYGPRDEFSHVVDQLAKDVANGSLKFEITRSDGDEKKAGRFVFFLQHGVIRKINRIAVSAFEKAIQRVWDSWANKKDFSWIGLELVKLKPKQFSSISTELKKLPKEQYQVLKAMVRIFASIQKKKGEINQDTLNRFVNLFSRDDFKRSIALVPIVKSMMENTSRIFPEEAAQTATFTSYFPRFYQSPPSSSLPGLRLTTQDRPRVRFKETVEVIPPEKPIVKSQPLPSRKGLFLRRIRYGRRVVDQSLRRPMKEILSELFAQIRAKKPGEYKPAESETRKIQEVFDTIGSFSKWQETPLSIEGYLHVLLFVLNQSYQPAQRGIPEKMLDRCLQNDRIDFDLLEDADYAKAKAVFEILHEVHQRLNPEDKDNLLRLVTSALTSGPFDQFENRKQSVKGAILGPVAFFSRSVAPDAMDAKPVPAEIPQSVKRRSHLRLPSVFRSRGGPFEPTFSERLPWTRAGKRRRIPPIASGAALGEIVGDMRSQELTRRIEILRLAEPSKKKEACKAVLELYKDHTIFGKATSAFAVFTDLNQVAGVFKCLPQEDKDNLDAVLFALHQLNDAVKLGEEFVDDFFPFLRLDAFGRRELHKEHVYNMIENYHQLKQFLQS